MSAGSISMESAVARLQAGGVVAFPTETVYGLGADALNEAAVRRVYELKGRPAANPLIVHVSDAEMAHRVVAEWPAGAERLARKFWPGPLTLVLPRAPIVPALVTAGGDTVAVRCPDHPLARDLISRFGGPLVGPSANRSGFVSPTTAEHVREEWDAAEVPVLDGGRCRVGVESTVLWIAGAPARVLRPGMITPEQIAAVLGTPVVSGAATAKGPLASPGMLPSHYAPRTPARMVSTAEAELAATPTDAALVTHLHAPDRDFRAVVTLPADPAGYAAGLYGALRAADASGAAEILIVRPEAQDSAWDAIKDRLARATAPRSDA